MSYSSIRPHQVTPLSAKKKKLRLQYTQAHLNWTIDDWGKKTCLMSFGFIWLHSDGRVRIQYKYHENMESALNQQFSLLWCVGDILCLRPYHREHAWSHLICRSSHSPLSTSQVFMYHCCMPLNLSSHFHNACSPPNSSRRERRLPEPVSEMTWPELNIVFTHSGPLSMKWVSFKGHSLPKRCCWPCPSLYYHCIPILW